MAMLFLILVPFGVAMFGEVPTGIVMRNFTFAASGERACRRECGKVVVLSTAASA